MVSRCGCASGACSCKFEDSTDVEWSGTGIKSDPFVAAPTPLLFADDTSTLALDLDVSDTTATLSAQPLLSSNVQTFTSSGTWTKPGGVTFVRVLMVGGGGGGAGGSVLAAIAGTVGGGGGAGDAGQVTAFTLIGVEIPATAAVTVGQGGAGGVAGLNGVPATVGGDGTDSQFAANSVRGGGGGPLNGAAPVHSAAGNPPGQFAVADDAAWTRAHYYLAPGAGGTGEGLGGIAAHEGGYSHPGQGSRHSTGITGGGVGDDGTDQPVTKMGGGGGGGAFGEAGGDGGNYGGGGGGGGGGFVGHVSSPAGNGGDGADGYVQVISW